MRENVTFRCDYDKKSPPSPNTLPLTQCVRWLRRLRDNIAGGVAVLHAGDETLPAKVLAAARSRRPIVILHIPTNLTYNLRKVLEVPPVVQVRHV